MVDLNTLSPHELVEFAHSILEEDGEKTASEFPYGVDLNELDVEDFLDFAVRVEDGMDKQAFVGKAARRYKELVTAKPIRERIAATSHGKRGKKGAKGLTKREYLAEVKRLLGGKTKLPEGTAAHKAHRKSVSEARKSVGAIAGTGAAAGLATTGGVVAMKRRKGK